MFTLPKEHIKKVKLIILSAEIVLTFLLCTSMLFIYHQYTETESEHEDSEKLRIESLKKLLGNKGKYVLSRPIEDPDKTENPNSYIHDHILGEFVIVCFGIFFIGLLVLGAVIDFKKPNTNANDVTTANYSEMVTRF